MDEEIFRNRATQVNKYRRRKQQTWKTTEQQQLMNDAVTCKELGKYSDAIALLTKAININPYNNLCFNERAKCYLCLKDYSRALKDAEVVCELYEIDAENFHNKVCRVQANYFCACLLAELGKQDESKLPKAQNRFKQALRLCSYMTQKHEIQGKYKRLRKLMWYKNREKQLSLLQLEKQIIFRASDRRQISEQKFKQLQELLQSRQKRLKAPVEIPSQFICKITLELMSDPVMTHHGFAYEHSALRDFNNTMKSRGIPCFDPVTRQQTAGEYSHCLPLKLAIDQFLVDNPWGYQFDISNYKDIQMI